MTEKVIGYTLLAVGVLIIIFSAVNIFMVFTGRAQPVQLFHTSGISLDFGSLISAQLLAGARSNLPAQKTEILPAEQIDLISNLTVQVFLMGFLAGAGFKLASLGVQLLKPVVLKLKDDKTVIAGS